MSKTITIDGVAYVPADSIPSLPEHSREVVVIDRGWIIGGDVDAESMPGHLVLHRAATLRRWSGGFPEAVAGRGEVELERHERPVYVPLHSVLFRCPAAEDWGLRED